MRIAVVNVKGGYGKSTCAVNLACELAGLDHRSTDRWQGKHSVVLVDADAEGTATQYGSHGHLPVSSEHLPITDWSDIEGWIQRVLAIQVDFIVVDAPPNVDIITKAIIGICDLVLVPWYSAGGVDLAAAVPMVELIRVVRSARSDGGPKCLFVPTGVNARAAAGIEMETVLSKLGETVGPVIHQREAFVDAFAAGRWIGDFAYNSAAHRDIKALASSVLQGGNNKNSGKTKRVSTQAQTCAMGATAAEETVEYSAGADGDSRETD
jgi:chromosome partitioning protein